MKQATGQKPATMIAKTLPALVLATAALAQTGRINQVTNPGVQLRMGTMIRASAALTVLGDMAGARAVFDKDRARTARQVLVAATRDIPSVFRRPHSDQLSHARPEIWLQWQDFTTRARLARRAAKALDTGAVSGLRDSLPGLILACLNCHDTYRKPM